MSHKLQSQTLIAASEAFAVEMPDVLFEFVSCKAENNNPEHCKAVSERVISTSRQVLVSYIINESSHLQIIDMIKLQEAMVNKPSKCMNIVWITITWNRVFAEKNKSPS
jgi:hypothetical protein